MAVGANANATTPIDEDEIDTLANAHNTTARVVLVIAVVVIIVVGI